MTIQEAEVAYKQRLPVRVIKSPETFGYYKPDSKQLFTISKIIKFYCKEKRLFDVSVELSENGRSTLTASLNSIVPADEKIKTLIDAELRNNRYEVLKKVLSSMLAEGTGPDDVERIVKLYIKAADKKTKVKPSEDKKEIINAVVEYLNKALNKTGKEAYRSSGKTIQRLIIARLNEGYELEDFKTVIDKKVKRWKDDPKMSEFLRPSTLFSSKFAEYLRELEAPPEPGKLKGKPSYDLEAIKKQTELNDDYDV